MSNYQVKLIEQIERTPVVESFGFLSEKKIEFLPGQFLRVIFSKEDNQLNKYLSFSSSPTKDYIEFTKKLSESRFSEKLKELKKGDVIEITAPLGNCVFKEDYKKIVFLIGGIGITPVISIIEYIVDKEIDTQVTLFYSNRREEDIAFKKELDNWSHFNKRIKVVYTLTDAEPKDKTCIFGRINKEIINENLESLSERVFFIFGPPRMVEAMSKVCLDLGIESDNIRTENFLGY